MDYEFFKRGYLLPEGCKDLIDALRLKRKPERPYPFIIGELSFLKPDFRAATALPKPPPPIIGELKLPGKMTARELAEMLKQKPFKIVADLMQLGIFATASQQIPFGAIIKVARLYGYTVKRAD